MTASDLFISTDLAASALSNLKLERRLQLLAAQENQLTAAYVGGVIANVLLASPWLQAVEVRLDASLERDRGTYYKSVDIAIEPEDVTLVPGAELPLDKFDLTDPADFPSHASEHLKSLLEDDEFRIYNVLRDRDAAAYGSVAARIDRESIQPLLDSGEPVSGWAVFNSTFPGRAAQYGFAVSKATEDLAAAHRMHAPTPSAKAVALVVEVTASADEAPSPGYAVFDLTQELFDRLQGLVALCKANGLSEARIPANPGWGPGEVEDGLRLQGSEMVVTAGGRFRVTDTPKDSDYHVDSKHLDLAEMREAFDLARGGETIFMAMGDEQALQSLYEEGRGEAHEHARPRGPAA